MNATWRRLFLDKTAWTHKEHFWAVGVLVHTSHKMVVLTGAKPNWWKAKHAVTASWFLEILVSSIKAKTCTLGEQHCTRGDMPEWQIQTGPSKYLLLLVVWCITSNIIKLKLICLLWKPIGGLETHSCTFSKTYTLASSVNHCYTTQLHIFFINIK